MKCPKCGYDNCDIVADMQAHGSDYSVCQGILGMAILGPLGPICGWTDNRTTSVDAYWVCKRCGYTFKA